eukprot:773069-Lingulodinium_polyedra.AAC.1
MSWHSCWYPGRFALACTGQDGDYVALLTGLQRDFAAYEAAKDKAASSTFLSRLVDYSCFNTTVVQEMAERMLGATAEDQEVRSKVVDIARHIYMGWGHTEYIESTFNRLRDRETRDTKDRSLRLSRQWLVAAESGIIEGHDRQCVRGEGAEVPAHQTVDPTWFHSKGRQPSIEAHSLTGKATWPTFTPISSQALYASRALFLQCLDGSCWELAANAFLGEFLVPGTVFLHKATKSFYLSLGCQGYLAVLVWPVVRSKLPGS